jgi:hypothetical protein
MFPPFSSFRYRFLTYFLFRPPRAHLCLADSAIESYLHRYNTEATEDISLSPFRLLALVVTSFKRWPPEFSSHTPTQVQVDGLE